MPPAAREGLKRVVGAQRVKNFLIILIFLFLAYIIIHIEATPISGRVRVMVASHEEVAMLSRMEAEEMIEQFKDDILDPSDPRVIKVQEIIERISWIVSHKYADDPRVRSNVTWNLRVIRSPAVQAMVLPTGDIFVFTALLELVRNEDQLAFVLAHEITHALLNHGAEHVSNDYFTTFLRSAIGFGIGSILGPGIQELILQRWARSLTDVVARLPHNREQEREADSIGLMLMSRACYNPHAAPAFFDLLKVYEEVLAEEMAKMAEEDKANQQQQIKGDTARQVQRRLTAGQPIGKNSVASSFRAAIALETKASPKKEVVATKSQSNAVASATPTQQQQAPNQPQQEQQNSDDQAVKKAIESFFEYFSTHPSDGTRHAALVNLVPTALQLQASDHLCPLCQRQNIIVSGPKSSSVSAAK